MSSPTLNQLPPPESKEAGWPWREGPERDDEMEEGKRWPKISIVTPSYNQSQFIEETIRSVLLQGYPNLEYIVVDGGSTDGSVEIIEKYDEWIDHWVSEPDDGQANAINKGLSQVTGEWFNWINSDDTLLPGALKMLVEIERLVPEAKWITGGRVLTDAVGKHVEANIPWRSNPNVIGLCEPRIAQDATFVRLPFMREEGIRMNEDIVSTFDTYFYLRLMNACPPTLTTALFSTMRQHPNQKTADTERRSQEGEKFIQPLLQSRPQWMQAYHRLMRTRLHDVFEALLWLGIRSGVVPAAEEWKAVVFDTVFDSGEFEWKVVSAKEAIW